MNIIQYLIPNFTSNTVYGLVLIVIGILVFMLSWAFPRSIDYKIRRVGWAVGIMGLILMFVISAIEDLFSNIKLVASLGALIVLGITAFIIYKK